MAIYSNASIAEGFYDNNRWRDIVPVFSKTNTFKVNATRQQLTLTNRVIVEVNGDASNLVAAMLQTYRAKLVRQFGDEQLRVLVYEFATTSETLAAANTIAKWQNLGVVTAYPDWIVSPIK